MSKLILLGLLLVIMISHVYSHESYAQRQEVEKIKESMKSETFMGHLIDCMYVTQIFQIGVCRSYRMRLAKDLFRLAYQYDQITHKCLNGEHDHPLMEACELYQLLKSIYPQYWEENVAAIKHAVEQKELIVYSLPEGSANLIDSLIDNGAIGVAVTECLIYRQPCFGVIEEIKDQLVYAQRLGNCLEPANEENDVCRLYFAFQINYPSLFEEIKNRKSLFQYDDELREKLRSTHYDL